MLFWKSNSTKNMMVPCSASPLTVPALSLGKGWNLCLPLAQSDFSFLESKGINERWTRASCGHKPPADMMVATSVTSAFRKLSKEDPWAQASLSYTVRAHLKNKDFLHSTAFIWARWFQSFAGDPDMMPAYCTATHRQVFKVPHSLLFCIWS